MMKLVNMSGMYDGVCMSGNLVILWINVIAKVCVHETIQTRETVRNLKITNPIFSIFD